MVRLFDIEPPRLRWKCLGLTLSYGLVFPEVSGMGNISIVLSPMPKFLHGTGVRWDP